MKKTFIFLTVAAFLLLSVGIIALSEDLSALNVNSENLGEDVTNFIENVAGEKGISEESIESINLVDFENLPENINLGNIDSNNLALYEIDMGDGNPLYMISVSDETYKKTLSSEDYKRSFLNFGSSKKVRKGFLETATGVETSNEKGYVMTRDGSITAMSTNLEVFEAGDEIIEIVLIKNGEIVGFGNSLTSKIGVVKDSDMISYGTVDFEAGDVISVYLKSDSQIKDITTLVEITTK